MLSSFAFDLMSLGLQCRPANKNEPHLFRLQWILVDTNTPYLIP